MLMNAAKGALRRMPGWVQRPVRRAWHEVLVRRGALPHAPLQPSERAQREVLARIGAEGIAAVDVNHLLHHFRTGALGRLPQGVPHFVSVGCAGTWYFNWINEMCGPKRHTGIEFFSPKPGDLPANAEWIVNTAGNMEALADGSADLLFSGQNIEHLWPADIAAFLTESHRVLKDGGLLVVDSPNRRVTELLQWSQPEHTVELDLEEIEELLALAGFDVESREGLWLCESPATGQVLPFAEITGEGEWPLQRRAAEAVHNPRSSFIWWVRARRAHRAPQPAALRERIAQIVAVAWPQRLNRLMTQCGRPEIRAGEAWFDSHGNGGTLMHGPYTAMPPGRHTVSVTLEYPEPPAVPGVGAVLQVTSNHAQKVWARREHRTEGVQPGQAVTLSVDFELAETTFAVEFVVTALPGVRLAVRKSVQVRSDPSL